MGLTRDQRRRARQIAASYRAESGVVDADSVPARGTSDAYGKPFDGLPANRLAYRGLTEDEHGSNSVSERALDTRDGSRAVSGAAAQDNFLLARHFPSGRIPSGVRMFFGEIDGEAGPAQVPTLPNIRGTLAVSQLPEVPPYKLPPLGGLNGKVARGQIQDRLNGDRLIKDSSLPISALASRPWPSVEEVNRLRTRISQLEKGHSSQGVRLTRLENKSHTHAV